jgi:hypothetical protein
MPLSTVVHYSQPGHPLHGVYLKLKRADENIINLQAEIDGFFKGCKYPVIPNRNDERLQEALKYYRELRVPLRFSVLAGEIVHHLRSSLDHIVWTLTDKSYKTPENESAIAFPILRDRPVTKREIASFDRKIGGVKHSWAVNLIKKFQPYEAADPLDDPLLIVHDMDRLTKHRELPLVITSVVVTVTSNSAELHAAIWAYTQGRKLSPREDALVTLAVQQQPNPRLNVAFPQFGKRKTQTIVPSLVQLLNHVVSVSEGFADRL